MSLDTEPALYTKLGFDPAYLPTFEDKIFIEGPQTRRRLANFFTLLLLATVIATYGVLSNSTATVIGAMIVAPLMGPMMAITSAVIMGSLPRALRALLLTVAGSIAVILFSYLLALIAPDFTISFTSNGEITSRINPGLYALLTALGAGAAGAFIISRAEIADALGGVAIPLSLTAYENITSIQETNTATATIENWLQGTPYQVDSVTVNGRVVSATIDGTGELKPLQELSNQLARVLHHPILVYLRTVPAQNSESAGP